MRKIMISILMLILILATPLSVNAFTDVGQNPYEEAIDSLSNSGVIEGFPDGTFKPDQAVNRAQFAAMVTRYLGVSESTLASFSNSSFKDMAGYYWAAPYLAYCQQEKIMLGDGKGNAMPGRTISYDEAITMVIRALDLEKDLDEELEWPASYLKLAKEIGLTNGITDGLKSTNRGVAAQLLFNGGAVGGAISSDADIKVSSVELYQPINGELELCVRNNVARNGSMDISVSLVLDHEILSHDTYKSLSIRVTTLNGAVTLAEKDFKTLLKKDQTQTIISEGINIEDVAEDNADVDSYRIHISDNSGILKTTTLNFFYDTTEDIEFASKLQVSEFRFYGNINNADVSLGSRQYYEKFYGKYKLIGVEIDVDNLDPGQTGWLPFTIEYKFPDGDTVAGTYWYYVGNNVSLNYYVYYTGVTGRYPNGTYKANVYVHEVLIGSGTFTIMSD